MDPNYREITIDSNKCTLGTGADFLIQWSNIADVTEIKKIRILEIYELITSLDMGITLSLKIQGLPTKPHIYKGCVVDGCDAVLKKDVSSVSDYRYIITGEKVQYIMNPPCLPTELRFTLYNRSGGISAANDVVYFGKIIF